MSLVWSHEGPLSALSVGHVTHDRYDDDTVPGGSAFYASLCFRYLGLETHLATSFASDYRMPPALQKTQLYVDDAPVTTVFRNTYPEGRDRVMKVSSIARPLLPQGTKVPAGPFDIVFLAPVIGEVNPEPWLDALDVGLVGLGLQGFIKQPGSETDPEGLRELVARPWVYSDQLLERLDAVFLSEEDIALGCHEGLLERLVAHVPFVVLTQGEKGAVLYERGVQSRVGVYPTVGVDPTGAGDTMATGFLTAMARGLSPTEAVRFGAAAASIVVEERGPGALCRLSQAHERVQEIPFF